VESISTTIPEILLDKSPINEDITKIACSVDKVKESHAIRTMLVYIFLGLCLSLNEAHKNFT
jgi:hypothetical protein